MIIYPSIDELSKDGKYNRYTLVIAAAKCARKVTDEYVAEREKAERLIANKETDSTLAAMIRKEYRDEKAVKNAINAMAKGEFSIVDETVPKIEKSISVSD